jgi:hypothetical protein
MEVELLMGRSALEKQSTKGEKDGAGFYQDRKS